MGQLTSYLYETRLLLQNPAATSALYADSDLTYYINTARGQVAGEGQCIRAFGSLAVTSATRSYGFGAINIASSDLGATPPAGIFGPLNVRQVWVRVGQTTVPVGRQVLRARPFTWFGLHGLNNPVPPTGMPKSWSVFGQGGNGTIILDPAPDQSYTLDCDCVCWPIQLLKDSDPEALPYMWTDAVPYFAAYMALMASQTGQRDQLADKMFQRYQTFVSRARAASTPEVLPWIYSQGPDPFLGNTLGMTAEKGGRGAGGA